MSFACWKVIEVLSFQPRMHAARSDNKERDHNAASSFNNNTETPAAASSND